MTALKTGIVLFILTTCLDLSAQNLIGFKETEIRQYMKEKHKDFIYHNTTFNNTFKYMKYQDRNEMITLLFFLTADSVCKSVRLVCDKSLEADKIKELNATCINTGKNVWSETRNGKKYIVELKEEEWTFNLTYSLND